MLTNKVIDIASYVIAANGPKDEACGNWEDKDILS